MSAKNITISFSVFVLAAAVGWFLAVRSAHLIPGLSNGVGTVPAASSTSATGTSSAPDLSSMKPGESVTLADGSTITALPIDTAKLPSLPKLDRPFIMASSTQATPEVVANLKSGIQTLVARLKKEPAVYDNWIKLGTYWKMADDIEGARIAWDYATKVQPTVPVAYSNLADLYGYYIHDTAKAKSYFDLALKNANSADAPFYYIKAAQFYLDIKDKSTALAILQKGFKTNSSSEDLKKAIETVKNN